MQKKSIKSTKNCTKFNKLPKIKKNVQFLEKGKNVRKNNNFKKY